MVRDYPEPGKLVVYGRSTDTSLWPENPNKFVRVDLKISGFLFEDNEDIKGCKITWIIQSDMKGHNVPKAWIN